jgi:hypothetical protein
MRLRRVALLALALSPAATAPASNAGSAWQALQPLPSRFACYPAQFSAFQGRKLGLVDELAKHQFGSVTAPQTICAPAGSDGNLDRSANYLTCYRMSFLRISGSNFLTARATDEFGKLTMRLLIPVALCVPSARVDQNMSAEPSTALGLFTCYSGKPTSAIDRKGVVVADDFGQSADDVRGPAGLCAASAKSGSTIGSRRSLTCYEVDSQTKASTVVVRNDFGILKAALGPRGQLCVAATFTAVATTRPVKG